MYEDQVAEWLERAIAVWVVFGSIPTEADTKTFEVGDLIVNFCRVVKRQWFHIAISPYKTHIHIGTGSGSVLQ